MSIMTRLWRCFHQLGECLQSLLLLAAPKKALSSAVFARPATARFRPNRRRSRLGTRPRPLSGAGGVLSFLEQLEGLSELFGGRALSSRQKCVVVVIFVVAAALRRLLRGRHRLRLHLTAPNGAAGGAAGVRPMRRALHRRVCRTTAACRATCRIANLKDKL